MSDSEEEQKTFRFSYGIKENFWRNIHFDRDMRNYLLNKGEWKESKTKEQIVMEVKDFDSIEHKTLQIEKLWQCKFTPRKFPFKSIESGNHLQISESGMKVYIYASWYTAVYRYDTK